MVWRGGTAHHDGAATVVALGMEITLKPRWPCPLCVQWSVCVLAIALEFVIWRLTRAGQRAQHPFCRATHKYCIIVASLFRWVNCYILTAIVCPICVFVCLYGFEDAFAFAD